MGVVRARDGRGEEEEGRARVCYCLVRGGDGRLGADGVGGGGELPEALGAVDWDEGQGAGELCRVYEAEVVVARCKGSG